jgi:polar amino acid transport system substrate-binding protein
MRRVLVAAVCAVLAGGTLAAAQTPPPTITPDRLTVGLSMPSEGFQVGAVRGAEVVLARGLEIDLARALALRLGFDETVFVQSRFDHLFSAGEKPWDVAIAQITITPERRRTAAFTRAYMKVDQGVLASQHLRPVPRTVEALRSLRVCAERKSTGAAVAVRTIKPTRPVLQVGNVPALLLDLQTGRCDVVVYDAPTLGTLKSRAPARYGPFVGVIRTGERYGVALPSGSPLLKRVDRALGGLVTDGTVERLQREWLTAHLEDLPVLR